MEKNIHKSLEAEESGDKREVTLDSLLTEEVGQFGVYQVRQLCLLTLALIFIALTTTEYIFTTARIGTRCLIPECEGGGGVEFSPSWLEHAVPSSGGRFDSCNRFANTSAVDLTGTCPAALFDQETVVSCDQHTYENTNTIVYDYDLGCDEWRRSLVGSVRTIGTLLALPLIGLVSDRWGRRTALAITAVNSAVVGCLRYFANTYAGFITSEFVENVIGSGGYSCVYILMLEIVGPKYRVAVSAALKTLLCTGQTLCGVIAWAVPNWRLFTLTIYVPYLLSISFFWIMPESVRWYLTKQRYDEAQLILKRMAHVNGKKISEQSLLALKENAERDRQIEMLKKKSSSNEPRLVTLVFQHKPILLRCVVTPIWWITGTFIYYGLTINSMNIAGNSYLNFIIVSVIEIPGFWIAFLLMNVMGRKPTLLMSFFICSACQFAYLFIPNDLEGASLALYLVGKCSIACVVTAMYVYTIELYPTQYRHRLFAFSSMIGRTGAIIAPLTPAFSPRLPFILFGSLALLAGLLALLMPETRGARFPDTMQQASDMATSKSQPARRSC